MKYPNNFQIVSGGQSGVDRAALDFALDNGILAAGWCPLNRVAEDGFVNYRYPLSSTFMASTLARTEMNVINSDGTLLIYSDEPDVGTENTRIFTQMHAKPLFIWKVDKNKDVTQFSHWMKKHNIQILNIAGPRASNQPEIYEQTLDLLETLLKDFVG